MMGRNFSISYRELEWRSGDVDVVELDAHGVDAELVGHEVDGVEAVLQLGDGGLVHLVKETKKMED